MTHRYITLALTLGYRILFNQMECLAVGVKAPKTEKASRHSTVLSHDLVVPILQGRSIADLCVEGFSQLLEIVEGEWPEKMEEFLGGVVPADKDEGDLYGRTHHIIRTLQVNHASLATGMTHHSPNRPFSRQLSMHQLAARTPF